MPKVKGFDEQYGVQLKYKNYVDNVLTKVAYKFGYKQIQIPLLEYATSFDENVVGKSPWPEWNSKGIFSFKISNYLDSYDDIPSEEEVLLIPEGTISVTRWLGDKLNNDVVEYPIKMFYNLSCYRNEIINELSQTKRREFHQFGCEILGTNCIQSDCEILSIIFESLENLNINKNNIRIRVNDISIYKKLCEESKIDYEQSIILKEKLDYLAECKAGKHPEKSEETYISIINYLKDYDLSSKIFKKWDIILKENSGNITNEMYNVFGIEYKELFDNLINIQREFANNNKTIFIDLCVIRSHEYYTGLSFETDVIYGDKKFIEIAGGGRFDRLVSNFINEKSEIIVPCTGFAFGTERLIVMLNDLGLFNTNHTLNINYDFDEESEYDMPLDDSINEYFNLYNKLKDNKNFNIYINKNESKL